jgi:dTDP-4-dehydrorhamnose reductase
MCGKSMPMPNRTLLLLGHTGQVGSAFATLASAAGWHIRTIKHRQDDLLRPGCLESALAGTQVAINLAAFTGVDLAESQPDAAFAANAALPERLAQACATCDLPLLHVSTDYVFGDSPAQRPWCPDDTAAPLGIYGASKHAGELQVRRVLARHVIVRTAWVFSATGRNFLTTMVSLASQRPLLRVVDDQIGNPTAASDLAAVLLALAGRMADGDHSLYGTHHFTGQPTTSWWGFAAAILQTLTDAGRPVPALQPISTAEYPTAARRPAYSVLDCTASTALFGLPQPDWRPAMRACVRALL